MGLRRRALWRGKILGHVYTVEAVNAGKAKLEILKAYNAERGTALDEHFAGLVLLQPKGPMRYL